MIGASFRSEIRYHLAVAELRRDDEAAPAALAHTSDAEVYPRKHATGGASDRVGNGSSVKVPAVPHRMKSLEQLQRSGGLFRTERQRNDASIRLRCFYIAAYVCELWL